MEKKLQEIELYIKDESKDGTFAISLVENPAIEENFIALSAHEVTLKVVDEEKRIVVGAALVPEKRIYRKMKPKGSDKELEFNIYFSKDTIEKSQELYMRNLYLNNVTSEHNKPVQGVSVIESWIVEDEKNDKSNIYNLKATEGTWVVKMKIYNDEEWAKVKDGEYKGFSIEGIYEGFEQLEMSKEESIIEQLKNIINGNH